MTRSIPWPRILAEGVAIVVSILLAFGIQAWWEESTARRTALRQAADLRAEFVLIQEQLRGDQREVETAEAATIEVLAGMADMGSTLGADSLAVLLNTSFGVNVARPEGGVFLALLGSGSIGTLEDDSLSVLLAEWPLIADEIQRLNDLLVASREGEIRGRLMTIGLPERNVASFLEIGPSRFPFDPDVLLGDVATESAFTGRLVRLRNMGRTLGLAMQHSSDVLARLGGDH